MSDSQKQKSYTVCSAIATRGNKIALKETPDGLSLLGGHVDWSLGLPQCITKRVIDENGLLFVPERINAIVQNSTPSGKWVTNINVIGPAYNLDDQRKIHWFAPNEALARSGDFRTKETAHLIQKIALRDTLPLDFIKCTYSPLQGNRAGGANTENFPPYDFTTAAGVIRYSADVEPEYFFMVCGRAQYKGKRSFFGGALREGESLLEGAAREIIEEAGKIPGVIENLIGVFVNHIGHDESGEPRFVANFPFLIKVGSREIELPEEIRQSDEVAGVEWLTHSQIMNRPEGYFRTRDTMEAALLAEHRILYGGLARRDYVQTIN